MRGAVCVVILVSVKVNDRIATVPPAPNAHYVGV